MGESRAALGAGLGGFQREPEPTLPEKPSELLRLFLEQLCLWGDKGWGSGSLWTTPPGVIFAGCTRPFRVGHLGRCGQADSQVLRGPWG